LDYYSDAWLPARDILVSSVQNSKAQVDPLGKVLLLEQFLPWKVRLTALYHDYLHLFYEKEHLFELEADDNVPALQPGQAIYVVYPDDTAGQWRIQAVPLAHQSFESRKALPEAWRGLRDDKLDQVTTIEGCVFVHASGFIGGALR